MIGSADAIAFPSQNFGPRRGTERPDLVVLHYTAMTSAEGARDWLCDPKAEVSAHYVIAEDGRIWQLVCESKRAWHAGVGAWGGVTDVNSHSIGIEIANSGFQPFPEPQMISVEGVLSGILKRWDIVPERVIGHSDCAIGRKIDPGARFDWARLARQGLAIEVDLVKREVDETGFLRDCRRAGYLCPEGKEHALLNALRLRHRPWASGELDAIDCGVAHALATRWPNA